MSDYFIEPDDELEVINAINVSKLMFVADLRKDDLETIVSVLNTFKQMPADAQTFFMSTIDVALDMWHHSHPDWERILDMLYPPEISQPDEKEGASKTGKGSTKKGGKK